MSDPTVVPWGLTRMRPLGPPVEAAYTEVRLDPSTQRGVYIGHDGRPIEAGKHGTSKEQKRSQHTGGGDGNSPTPPDDTEIIEYVPD
ncbi:putative ATP-grasp-modified RiPP [Thermopolyspora sp. NPDC052614]|uniref:putative ATP-grasp-modified RiPP n=1 Tax=Thermopolyspora sp. NPDC052614 TaxID=3155682 RepID=UPI00342071B2